MSTDIASQDRIFSACCFIPLCFNTTANATINTRSSIFGISCGGCGGGGGGSGRDNSCDGGNSGGVGDSGDRCSVVITVVMVVMVIAVTYFNALSRDLSL